MRGAASEREGNPAAFGGQFFSLKKKAKHDNLYV